MPTPAGASPIPGPSVRMPKRSVPLSEDREPRTSQTGVSDHVEGGFDGDAVRRHLYRRGQVRHGRVHPGVEGEAGLFRRRSDHGTDETEFVQRGRGSRRLGGRTSSERVPRGRLQPGQALGCHRRVGEQDLLQPAELRGHLGERRAELVGRRLGGGGASGEAREVIHHIEELNALAGATLQPGQRLAVPVG